MCLFLSRYRQSHLSVSLPCSLIIFLCDVLLQTLNVVPESRCLYMCINPTASRVSHNENQVAGYAYPMPHMPQTADLRSAEAVVPTLTGLAHITTACSALCPFLTIPAAPPPR